MAVNQTTEAKSSNGFLYFAVGALIVAVGVLAYFYFNGQPASQSPTESAIERSADAIGDAAKDISKSASDAAKNVTPPATPAPAPVQPSAPTVPPG
jgi:hypothetical protein